MIALRLHDLPELSVDQGDADEYDEGHYFHCCSFLGFMLRSPNAPNVANRRRRTSGAPAWSSDIIAGFAKCGQALQMNDMLC
jgi:hypothetical protein